jgi:SAM-dependent methyltransferase
VLCPPAGYPSFDVGRLVGIEPSSGMRAAWDRGVAKLELAGGAEGAGASTVDGGFTDFSRAGVQPASADAVIVAQAWHWCPDYDAALREAAAYLRPGAPLVLVWNLESNADAWHAALRELYQPLDLGSPQYYRMLWRKMFDTAAYKDLFEPAAEAHFPWEMGMDEDQVVERLFSKSYLTEAHLNGDKRVQFDKDVRRIIREGDKEWVDNEVSIRERRLHAATTTANTLAEGHLQVQVCHRRLGPVQEERVNEPFTLPISCPIHYDMSASFFLFLLKR